MFKHWFQSWPEFMLQFLLPAQVNKLGLWLFNIIMSMLCGNQQTNLLHRLQVEKSTPHNSVFPKWRRTFMEFIVSRITNSRDHLGEIVNISVHRMSLHNIMTSFDSRDLMPRHWLLHWIQGIWKIWTCLFSNEYILSLSLIFTRLMLIKLDKYISNVEIHVVRGKEFFVNATGIKKNLHWFTIQ